MLWLGVLDMHWLGVQDMHWLGVQDMHPNLTKLQTFAKFLVIGKGKVSEDSEFSKCLELGEFFTVRTTSSHIHPRQGLDPD